MAHRLKNWRRHLLVGAVGLLFATILIAAFLAYIRPEFVLDLANRITLC